VTQDERTTPVTQRDNHFPFIVTCLLFDIVWLDGFADNNVN
jgi:hypothetical protein